MPCPFPDEPSLELDLRTGRTIVYARTAGPVGRFLGRLVERWGEQHLVAKCRCLPSAYFQDPEACHEVERQLATDLWAELGQRALMPLEQPVMEWGLVPGFPMLREPPSGDEAITKIIAEQRGQDMRPGPDLPPGTWVLGRLEVRVVALPAAQRRSTDCIE